MSKLRDGRIFVAFFAAVTVLTVALVLLLGVVGSGARYSHTRAVLARFKVRMSHLAIDGQGKRVFGVQGRNILSLDETSGITTVLGRVATSSLAGYLAFDPNTQHLVVGVTRVDAARNARTRGTATTTLAYIVDANDGSLINTATVGHGSGGPLPPADVAQSVTVDSARGRGFVVDDRGQGAVIDMATGQILSRFHTSPPNPPSPNRPARRLDRGAHRLLIAGADRHHVRVFDTRTSKLVRVIRVPEIAVAEMALDDQNHQLFLAGPPGAADSRFVIVLDSEVGL